METTDAITNPANSLLQHYGGLAGQIRKKAGNQLELESKSYIRDHGELLVGKCCVTNAGELPSKYVIHSVGPLYNKYSPSKCDELLQNCILNTLELAKKL